MIFKTQSVGSGSKWNTGYRVRVPAGMGGGYPVWHWRGLPWWPPHWTTDVIKLFSRWRRWKRRWRRCFARKLRRSTQRYKKEIGAKNYSEYPHNILDKPAFCQEIPLVWDIKTSSSKESITWNFRDFEQRMLKEREVLEEERQSIAARREEYLREVKEWEERLDTVGQCSVWLRNLMPALFSLRMSPNIFGNSACGFRSLILDACFYPSAR